MKLNIAVFFGGESVEHEVSIISAHQAIEALDKNKYNVIPVYVSKERKLYVSDLLKDMSNYKDLKHLISQCTQVSITSEDNRVVIRPVKPTLFGPKEKRKNKKTNIPPAIACPAQYGRARKSPYPHLCGG